MTSAMPTTSAPTHSMRLKAFRIAFASQASATATSVRLRSTGAILKKPLSRCPRVEFANTNCHANLASPSGNCRKRSILATSSTVGGSLVSGWSRLPLSHGTPPTTHLGFSGHRMTSLPTQEPSPACRVLFPNQHNMHRKKAANRCRNSRAPPRTQSGGHGRHPQVEVLFSILATQRSIL